MSRALVWFKRDLRLADHAPLVEAARCEAALALFIIEPACSVIHIHSRRKSCANRSCGCRFCRKNDRWWSHRRRRIMGCQSRP
jgi:hypothetical protein